ncbi:MULTISPECIES: TonB-dependent receptor domain-containing protein [unclassified Sphingobium]|uniref:TonB-dependent receptor domain-containing protein n=1 Tax=unclassified Sphingobium TaxID=2611147 RepID=UPI000AA3A8C8|nr:MULTISPECIES: TonB-dependent receptor [unclassified Sphingobium]
MRVASTRLALLSGIAFAAMAPPGPSFAQQQGAAAPADGASEPPDAAPAGSPIPAPSSPPAPSDPPVEADIVVSGSRIVRDGFNAPTPISVIGAEQVQNRAAISIGSVLQEAPAFRPSQNPSAARTFTNSGYYADLRGLDANRTLVLVDGHRFVPTSNVGTVDLSLIPTFLVERAEVVTGGASAAWGSDAVAGVVNIILDHKLTGLRGEAQAGISEEGDGYNMKVALGGGTSFADGAGHIILGAEYSYDEGVGDNYTRDWGREEWWFVTNPNFATNGQPARIWTKNVHYASQTPGGLIATGPLRGTAFAPDGTPFQFNFGEVWGDDQIGGDGYGIGSWTGVNIRQPHERVVAMGRVSFESGDTSFFAEGNYAHVDWTVPSIGTRNFGTQSPSTSAFSPIVVSADNPFIPAATRAAIDNYNATRPAGAPALTSFQLGRFGTENFQQIVSKANETARGLIGAEGSFGGIKWDVYAQYGQNRFIRGVIGQRIEANWRRAIDVVNVMQNGVSIPVCRDLLSPNAAIRNAAAGCVPYNIFGTGTASEAAKAYVTGLSLQHQKTTQTVVAGNLQAEPFSTWAGPVSIATGIEYRRETLLSIPSPLEAARAFSSANSAFVDGSFDVKEGYVELLVPLAADRPFFRHLDVNAAARYADYSGAGSVWTWKAGVNWSITDEFRVRATRSRDVRAPNLTEMFTPERNQNARIIDPVTNAAYTVRTFSVGNRNLEPEVANSLTAGFVYQPQWASGLQLSVDYYDIDIDGVINTSVAQVVLDSCVAGDASRCAFITRPVADGPITEMVTPYLNLNRFQTSGVDIELSYRMPLGAGNLSTRLLATYVWDYRLTDTTGAIDRSGQNGTPVNGGTVGMVDLTMNATIAYDTDDFGVNLQARYINDGKIDTAAVPGTATSLNINRIPSRIYFNLGGKLVLTRSEDNDRKVELFGTIDNLLDTDPPFPSFDGTYYDLVGRAYRLGVRFRY